MSDWKSSEDGTTKGQREAEEKRREQLRRDLPMGNYRASVSRKEPMPPIPQMEATKFKKYEKAEYMKARRKPVDSLPKK